MNERAKKKGKEGKRSISKVNRKARRVGAKEGEDTSSTAKDHNS